MNSSKPHILSLYFIHTQFTNKLEEKNTKQMIFSLFSNCDILKRFLFIFCRACLKSKNKKRKSSNFSLAPFVPVSWKWLLVKTWAQMYLHLSVSLCLTHTRASSSFRFPFADVVVAVVVVYRRGVSKSYKSMFGCRQNDKLFLL